MTDIPTETQFSESELLLLKILTFPKTEALGFWDDWKSQFLVAARTKLETRQLSRVFCVLHSYGADAEELKAIQCYFNRNKKRIQTYLEALDPVLEWLNSSKIPVMILKSASFLALGQEKLGSRAMFDLDILVPYEHAEQVYQYLCSNEWSLDNENNPLPTGSGKRFYHSVDLRHSNGGKIDLHWHVMQDSLNHHSDLLCWRRARKAFLGEREVFVLSPEDLFLLICIHGWQGHKKRYDWAADIKILLNAEAATLDWDYLVSLVPKRHLVEPFQKSVKFLTTQCLLELPAEFVRSVESLKPSLAERVNAFGRASGNNTLIGGLPYRISTALRMSPPGLLGFLATFLRVLKDAWDLEGDFISVVRKIVARCWGVPTRFFRTLRLKS